MTASPDRSRDALLLSQLYERPEDEIASVRKRYLDRSSTIASARLAQVRHLLGALCVAIHRNDAAGWEAVDQAHRVLGTIHNLPPPPTVEDTAAEDALAGGATIEPKDGNGTPAEPSVDESAPTVAAWTAPGETIAKPAVSDLAASKPLPLQTPAVEPPKVTPFYQRAIPPSDDTLSSGPQPAPESATPFRTGEATPPPAAPLTDDERLPPSDSGTVSVAHAPIASADAPNPYNRASGGVPRLTVQQYAKLCAHRRTHPQDTETFARYGVHDEQTMAALDEEWRAKLVADSTSRELFDLLVTRLSGS